jgi:hypothetical protein
MTEQRNDRPDVDTMVLDPAEHFDAPKDVLTAPGLSEASRRRILESWVEDAKRISEAEAENMTSAEARPRLREATLALLALRRTNDQR